MFESVRKIFSFDMFFIKLFFSDIWSKEPVQELIKKNFVFWQVADDSADCKRVAAYYNVTSFPTVLIIDPRTGESVTTLTRLRDPVSFLEECKFCCFCHIQ